MQARHSLFFSILWLMSVGPAAAAEQVLRFHVYDASGKPSTAQVLDFRGAVSLNFEPVGDYVRTPTGLEVRWNGEQRVQIFVRWEEADYGPAYLLLDNEGKGYGAGGTLNFNVELARLAWRCFDLAYQEDLKQPELNFKPSEDLEKVREEARRALRRMELATQARARSRAAVAAATALARTLTAWTALLKEYGRAFARKHRQQFVLGAMMTEPWGDAWQYSPSGMFTDYDKRLTLMKRQGVDTVGIVFLWRDDYTFSRPESFAAYDRVVDYANRVGLQVMAFLLDSYDNKTHQTLSDEEFVSASRTQARNLAMHYKGRIKFWTVTDETNGKNFLPHSFEARLKAGNEAARTIKEVDPASQTLATLYFDEDLLCLLAQLKTQKSLAREIDALTLSLYYHLGPGIDLVYRKIHELFPEKKVGVGESGYMVGKDCDLIYSAPLNYSYSLGGGFWWFHWDSMIDRGIDAQWYTTRFYRALRDLAVAISDPALPGTPTPPPAVTGLAAHPDPIHPAVALIWQPLALTSLAEYRVYRSEQPLFGADAELLVGRTAEPNLVDDSVRPARVYYYRVATVNLAGSIGGLSDAVEVRVGERFLLPQIERVLTSPVTAESARLEWQTDEATTARLEWEPSSGPGRPTAVELTKREKVHAVTLRGLAPRTAYHFKVRVTDGGGLTNQTRELSFATLESSPPLLYEDAAWRGSRWLLQSGVFDAQAGGVAEAYDASTEKNSPASVRNTALALQVFLKDYRRSRDPVYLDAARKAANFLAACQFSGPDRKAAGAILAVSGEEPATGRGRAESLPNARALEALMDFYFATGEEKYLAASERIADWLLSVMQNPDGSFKAAYVLEGKSFVDGARDEWPYARALSHAKIAAALLKVWEGSKETEPRYREGALKVLAWALTLQNENGSFKGHYNPLRGQANDDKYLANLNEGVQGFFSAYVYLLRHPRDIALHPIYFEALRNFADWLMRSAQGAEGGVWELVLPDDSHRPPATFPTAQALRLWLRLYLTTKDPKYLDAARRAGDFLAKVQNRSSDPRADGGFPLGEALPSSKRLLSGETAEAVVALHELYDVMSDPDLVLNPTLARYTGFDPLF